MHNILISPVEQSDIVESLLVKNGDATVDDFIKEFIHYKENFLKRNGEYYIQEILEKMEKAGWSIINTQATTIEY